MKATEQCVRCWQPGKAAVAGPGEPWCPGPVKQPAQACLRQPPVLPLPGVLGEGEVFPHRHQAVPRLQHRRHGAQAAHVRVSVHAAMLVQNDVSACVRHEHIATLASAQRSTTLLLEACCSASMPARACSAARRGTGRALAGRCRRAAAGAQRLLAEARARSCQPTATGGLSTPGKVGALHVLG